MDLCLTSNSPPLPGDTQLSQCQILCAGNFEVNCFDDCLLGSAIPISNKLSMMKDIVITQACESVCPEGSEICVTMCKPETNDLLQLNLISLQA